MTLLLKPALNPASVAVSSGSSAMAAMIRARWTSRIDSLRDAARRWISALSSVVKARKRVRLGMLSSYDSAQEDSTTSSLLSERTTKPEDK